jgi:hypothetical protein
MYPAQLTTKIRCPGYLSWLFGITSTKWPFMMQYTISSNEMPLSVMSRAFFESSHTNGLSIWCDCIMLCALWQHVLLLDQGDICGAEAGTFAGGFGFW